MAKLSNSPLNHSLPSLRFAQPFIKVSVRTGLSAIFLLCSILAVVGLNICDSNAKFAFAEDETDKLANTLIEASVARLSSSNKFTLASPKQSSIKSDLQSAAAFLATATSELNKANSSFASAVQSHVPALYSQSSASLINKRNSATRSSITNAIKQLRTDISNLLKKKKIKARKAATSTTPFGVALKTLPAVGQTTALEAAQTQVGQMRSFDYKLIETLKKTPATSSLSKSSLSAIVKAIQKDLSYLSSVSKQIDDRLYSTKNLPNWTYNDIIKLASQEQVGLIQQIQDGAQYEIRLGFNYQASSNHILVNFKSALLGAMRQALTSNGIRISAASLPAECNATGDISLSGVSFNGAMDNPECGFLKLTVDSKGRLKGNVTNFPANADPSQPQLQRIQLEGLIRASGSSELAARFIYLQSGISSEILGKVDFGDAAPEVFTSVQAGYYKASLLTNKGNVYSAALKFSPYGTSAVVRKVQGISSANSVSCGIDCYAATSSGALYKWSLDNSTMEPASAQLFSDITEVNSVAVGKTGFVIALKNDGTIWSWGANDNYQLGDGTTTQRDIPAQMAALGNDNKQIAAGEYQGVVLKNDGSIIFWGRISNQPSGLFTTPTSLGLGSAAKRVAAGGSYNLALLESSEVYAWGHLSAGIVPSISSPKAISAGAEMYYSPLFLKSDGSIWKVGFSMIDGSMQTPEQMNGLSDIVLMDAYNIGCYTNSSQSVLLQASPDTVPYEVKNVL